MSSGVNDPLPRMSREDAEAWAAHWIESLARTTGGEIDEDTKKINFFDCLGKNDEIAEDGRFDHSYSARVVLSPEARTQAVIDIRDTLEEKGFEVTSYRSDPSLTPANMLRMRHPEDHQSVTAEDFAENENHLLLIVRTPCLLPPDVEQQQF
ncbi:MULTISPECIES: hypothetical protein [Streptomyces]|uniref:hypothetical protein n=1 Tax=Streptomyces TaxID=1883 RepID=UPI0019042A12|nr:hypothetical protein [Streptomyces sp. XC 2026]QQN78170.1 hypothetical protein IPZ77_12435 [Streptomyces sp. XC 2026]